MAMTAIDNAREGDGDHVAVLRAVRDRVSGEYWVAQGFAESQIAKAKMAALDAAIAAMQAQQGAEPVAWQFREAGSDHDWSLALNRKHADDTAASPDWEVRALYPATGTPR